MQFILLQSVVIPLCLSVSIIDSTGKGKIPFLASKIPMMACQKFALLSSRTTLLLFVLLSVGLCYDGCDMEDCSSVFKAAFSKLISSGIDSLCWDVKQVSKCLKDCQQVFYPHHLDINTTISFLKEICDEEFVYDVSDHWECIRKHINKFFMCVARSSSIQSTSGSNNGKLITCRRKLMIFDCPEEVFYNHCEDEAVQIVSKKFKAVLKPWLNSSCYGIPQNKVYNLDVKPVFESDLDSTAYCMDTYNYLAEGCFSDYLETAVHSENHCWMDTMLVCNKPSSSIPCSPLSSVANFYSTLFSFGKLDCREASSVPVTKSDADSKTYRSSPEDFEESQASTKSIQPPPSTTDSADTLNFPETKPPFLITDLKPNDENILPSNHMPDLTPTEEINSNFTLFASSLNVTSSDGIDVSSVKNIIEFHIVTEKSVSSHSHCTNLSVLLFLSCIFMVIFFPN